MYICLLCCCYTLSQIGQGANGRPGAAGSSNAGADSSSSSGTAGAVASSAECSYVKKRIGFRTVELVTDPLDKAVQVRCLDFVWLVWGVHLVTTDEATWESVLVSGL